MKSKFGFTLIEVLVVSALLFSVGVLVVQLFFSTIKGTVKSTTLTVVKQNGDFALTIMERMIHNAREVISPQFEDCAAPPDCFSTFLQITNPDGGITTFICDTSSTPNRIASRSGLLGDEQYLTSENVAVSCSAPGEFFNYGQLNDNKVGINFTVSQYLSGTTPKVEETAQMDFKTTVTLRNY